MSTHILDEAIIASLQPMFQEAENKGLWFFHHSPDGGEIWCSPRYLHTEQDAGRLVMAPEHWELRDPVGYMKKLVGEAQALVDEYNELAMQLGYEETIALESHSTHPADRH